MPMIDRDGVAIHYTAQGSGPPVLLSHGYGATCRMWDGQVSAFAGRHRSSPGTCAANGRRPGRSGRSDSQALTRVGDMRGGAGDRCEVERAVIGGLSLGGVMSLAFHIAHPERVAALLLCDTGPGFRNPEARAQWNERALARARELDDKGFAALSGGDETRLGAHRSARGLAGAARGMLAQFDDGLIRSLPGIAVPTLVLVGSEDTHFLGAADYMASKIPGARKAVIEGAGHAANLDRPKAFNTAVGEFLAGLPAN